MRRTTKRRRIALPLGAGLVGAAVAAFTIFAAALPAAAADGGGSFTYAINDGAVTAAPGDDATVTLALSELDAGDSETSMSACWSLTGDDITDPTSGFVNFDPATATSVDITIPIDDAAADGDSATLSIADTCDHGSDGTATNLTDTANGTATAMITVEAETTVTVTNVSPNHGTTGTDVTITGEGFTGATAVSFGGVNVSSFTVDSDTQISTTVPNGLTPGAVAVAVTGPAGTGTLPSAFTVEASTPDEPTITTVAPGSGPVGTTITITGTNLATTTGVTVGGVTATDLDVVGDTSVTAVVPDSLDPGTYDVAVTTEGGTATADDAFEVTESDAPTVTDLDPDSGTAGTSVVITGTNFVDVTAVTFGGVDAESYTVDSDTQITAVAPEGMASGEVDVVVSTEVGDSATSDASKFTNTESANETVTITLQGTFTLIGWIGEDGISVADALAGGVGGPHNGTNDITDKVTVVWGFDAATQTWKAYFPNAANVPGANDLTTLHTGMGYFVGLVDPDTPVQWTMEYGNVEDDADTTG